MGLDQTLRRNCVNFCQPGSPPVCALAMWDYKRCINHDCAVYPKQFQKIALSKVHFLFNIAQISTKPVKIRADFVDCAIVTPAPLANIHGSQQWLFTIKSSSDFVQVQWFYGALYGLEEVVRLKKRNKKYSSAYNKKEITPNSTTDPTVKLRRCVRSLFTAGPSKWHVTAAAIPLTSPLN